MQGQRKAVIGLGSMGMGAALSLLRAGFAVNGVDLRADVREVFESEGGTPVANPAEAAANADVVFSFVVNAEQTEQILFGENGIVGAAAPGTVIACCATIPASKAMQLGERLAGHDLLMLDAPVSGGAVGAMAGSMTVMAAGSPDAFDRAGPALEAIAGKIYRLGDEPGAGSKMKMINQLLAGSQIAAMAEALTLAAKSGLDLRTVFEVISVSAGNSWVFQNRGPHVLDGDYSPRSTIDIWIKDLGIVLREAEALGFPARMAQAAMALYEEAVAQGLAKDDDAALAKVYARASGTRLPGDD